jgi:ectoine hydroxylase-related dioxygenase (phytanoyl-CoA dioxygenase family)
MMPTHVPTATAAPPMTAAQRQAFEDHGFLVLPGALSPDEVDHYAGAVDDLFDRTKQAGQLAADGSFQRLGAVRTCPPLAGLLDHPAVFPLVWSMLGWNVHVCHSHINVHPTLPSSTPPRWRWHQDGSRQCLDLETDLPPRLSIFVGFWLSDVSSAGRGNLTLIPGSHRQRWLQGPPDPTMPWPTPEGAIELTAEPGDVVLFDRRIWHTRSDNHSPITRKVVFLGYTFRWIFSRDDIADIEKEPWYDDLSPVQQQLLGAGDGTGDDQWGMRPDGVPLYIDLRERGLLDPNNRLHRRFVP